MAASPVAAQSPSLEYGVKAAYLSKFAPFVVWPEGAFASTTSPFVVCVAGDDPFGPGLERTLSGQRVGSRPVTVKRLAKVDARGDCHVLYLAGSKAQPVVDALAAVKGTPVLTVTDARTSGSARGIVHFAIQANKVRFHIDDRAAQAHGLGMSSKLLSLALSVRSRS